ncbi:15883_t:CDS:2 [Dentiscutata heterogama]|uniref:15883_t:CDS:1 n=1 Tax=Dentiscutata heterogama TaxID=1316150 RepID=A0ACA9K2A3_9GLOM|nr:15883_t:CDS:2 [Dentiscutata heterogama]
MPMLQSTEDPSPDYSPNKYILRSSSKLSKHFQDPVPPKLLKPFEPPAPEEEPESEEEEKNNYKTTDNTSNSESESDNRFKSEKEDKIIFRRIEDPALKRLVETRRISDQGLYIDHLAIISETYPYQEDSLAMFEDIEDQISDIYRKKLAQLGGIKIKIVLIAHMYQIVQGGYFEH